MINLVTNRGKTFHRPSSVALNPFEYVQVMADTAGDVAYIDCRSMFKPGLGLGATFQAGKGGGIQIWLTQAPFEQVNAANDALIPWHAWTSLVASAMATPELLFTAAKVLFVAPNTLTIMSV